LSVERIMADEAHIDLGEAHKHFSAWCFNRAWDPIEKPDRTETDALPFVSEVTTLPSGAVSTPPSTMSSGVFTSSAKKNWETFR
jgi:hypothetical protein